MPDADCYDRFVVPQRFDGRVVLITGSTGIAAASARRLAAEGAALVVASRTEEHCRSLVEAITSAGGAASYEVADLTEDGAADRIVAATVDRHGRIDGVFSVAGGSGRRFGDGPAHEATPEGWDATLDLNALDPVSRVGRRRAPDADAGSRCGRPARRDPAHGLVPAPAHRDLFATHAYAAAQGRDRGAHTAMAAVLRPGASA